jgi:D-serine deaminase-like pyridoxal phosphate-dependent protein
MRLADLPTPCLVLDRPTLQRNIDTMARAVARHGLALRPHMKTAKSIDVARLALQRSTSGRGTQPGITVSTLAEAEYFVGHGIADILYAVGITPQKLDQVAKLNTTGAEVMVITDDTTMATAIAGHPMPPRVLIEIDTGEARGGLSPDEPALLEIAARLGPLLAGVMTHAGHSYAGRSPAEMQRIAEQERAGAVRAAERLVAAGHACPIVSIGSSPTALAATSLVGITEVRAGVYMFGDLFQAEIGTNGPDDIALTVLASVIGRRPAQGMLLVDAGAIALSKDRSTEATGNDQGFGALLDINARRSFGRAIIRKAYQEHGVVELDPALPPPNLPVGSKVRILPNHCCLTAAAHDSYFVVDGTDTVAAVWPRVNGW